MFLTRLKGGILPKASLRDKAVIVLALRAFSDSHLFLIRLQKNKSFLSQPLFLLHCVITSLSEGHFWMLFGISTDPAKSFQNCFL